MQHHRHAQEALRVNQGVLDLDEDDAVFAMPVPSNNSSSSSSSRLALPMTATQIPPESGKLGRQGGGKKGGSESTGTGGKA